MNERKAGAGGFSPGQTFAIGMVGGILVLCTIGFFILLAVVFDDTDDVADRPAGTNPTVVNNQPTAPTPTGNTTISFAPVDEKKDHIRGAEDAKITIIEYSDLECPFCARFHPTMEQIIANYGDDVRWIWRHFPLESIHPKARSLAHATECAGEQDKFWEMTDAIIADNGAQPLDNYVSAVGLNTGNFSACMDSGKYNTLISQQAQDAQSAGGQGTPHSIVIGEDGVPRPLSGAQPYSAVEAVVKQLL